MEIDDSNSTDRIRVSTAYRVASAFLYGRIDYERAAKVPYTSSGMNLVRLRRLLELIGNPHQRVRAIHVAGTKGKGSTSAFLSSVLTEAGYKCGVYSSPHLHEVEERFLIGREPCPPQRFVELMEQIRPAVMVVDVETEGVGPTYFEILTAIGFEYFASEEVDVAVLEVGLGGRLDSTNVCEPIACVITSISFDHTKQLGNTLALIAGEKAGIIKPGVPVVSGATHPEAQQVISSIAKENHCPFSELGVDFRVGEYVAPNDDATRTTCCMDIETHAAESWVKKLEGLHLGLIGRHQACNAAIAYATLMQLPADLQVSDQAIQAGFRGARCAARVEIVDHEPLTIVDAAHNVASVEALVAVLHDSFPERRSTLLLAMTKGKDVTGMLRILLPEFDRVVCTRYLNNPRAYSARRLHGLATEIATELGAPCTNSIEVAENPQLALKAVMDDAKKNDLICVTGSFFIAAEVRELMGAG